VQAQLPSVEDLRARIKNVRPLPLNQNTFYRDSPVAAYSLYGSGPLHGLNRGGRYSPAGTFPVLYFAADRLQAQLEVAHHINRHLPADPSDQIRELHIALSSYKVQLLQAILQEMASSDEGYRETDALTEYLQVPIVDKLFHEDPARLQVFLDLAPHLKTPLRCSMDSSRISLSINITARGVLDLNNAQTLETLGIGTSELLTPTDLWEKAPSTDYTLTQRLGLAAWDAPGIDGILAPTALAKEHISGLVIHPVNLILFMHEKECHLPRSNSVRIDTEEEFVKLTKLFWVHRPQWLIAALEKHEPDAAQVLKRINRR
jgi:RES domain